MNKEELRYDNNFDLSEFELSILKDLTKHRIHIDYISNNIRIHAIRKTSLIKDKILGEFIKELKENKDKFIERGQFNETYFNDLLRELAEKFAKVSKTEEVKK